MPKKIIYWTRIYQPESEAVSREVSILHSHNKGSFLYSMTSLYGPLSILDFRIGRRKLVYCYLISPLRKTIPFYEKKFDISHIFGNINNSYYLRVLKKKPIVHTLVTNERIASIEQTKKIDVFVVESNRQKESLMNAGVDDGRIRLIYPSADLERLSHTPCEMDRFNVLFASSPMTREYFKRRGLDILLETAGKCPDVSFNLLWRRSAAKDMKKILAESGLKNVNLIDRIIKDMNAIYGVNNATIAPFVGKEENKACPNSIIESLAAGKPVLVSSDVGISDVILKEKCGVVFSPDAGSLMESLQVLRDNYATYQGNARPCAERYFSKKRFIEEYEEIYETL